MCSDISVANYPSSVPDHSHKINIKKGEAITEQEQIQSSKPDKEIQQDASISLEPSVLIDVHERKAPWASSLDD